MGQTVEGERLIHKGEICIQQGQSINLNEVNALNQINEAIQYWNIYNKTFYLNSFEDRLKPDCQ